MTRGSTGITLEERAFIQYLMKQEKKIKPRTKIENFGSITGKTIKTVRYSGESFSLRFTDGTKITFEVIEDDSIGVRR